MLVDGYDSEITVDWPIRSFYSRPDNDDGALAGSVQDEEEDVAENSVGRIRRNPVPQSNATSNQRLAAAEDSPPGSVVTATGVGQSSSEHEASSRQHGRLSSGEQNLSVVSANTIAGKDQIVLLHDLTSTHGRRDTGQGGARHFHYWNPFWLSYSFLFSFAIACLIFVALLIVLRQVSQSQNGFPLWTTNHYAWTYGPTAVLVLLVSLWRQADFWVKSLVPWQELQKGNAMASRSMFLDYVFPIQILTLWRSLKNGHFVVVLTICGFILLKIITVISTGLLVLKSTVNLPQDTLLYLTRHLNATEYPAVVDISTNVEGPGSSTVYMAYALIAADLPYPEGVAPDAVYETFTLPANQESISNVSFTAEVDAFFPDMNCEVAEIVISLPTYDEYEETEAPANISSPFCRNTAHTGYGFSTTGLTIQDPRYSRLPPRAISIQLNPITCIDDSEHEQLAQALITFSVRYNQTFGKAKNFPEKVVSWHVEIDDWSAAICQPGYGIGKTNVTYNYEKQDRQISISGPISGHSSRELFGLNASNLWLGVNMVLSDTVKTFGQTPGPFFKLMSTALQVDYEAFLNASTMIRAANTAFKGIANQIVYKYILEPTNGTVRGQLTTYEDRLFISTLPVWLMTAIFFTMAGAATLLALSRPFNIVPCNIEAICGHALILARSTALQGLLQGLGSLSFADLRQRMSDRRFHTSVQTSQVVVPTFLITASNYAVTDFPSSKMHNQVMQW